jgi:hypothetical protein
MIQAESHWMKFSRLVWLFAIAPGCATPAISNHPLTWEQVNRVGAIGVEDPTWKGDLLRLPVRVSQANDDSFVVLSFKGEVSENLICITASRVLGEKTPSEIYEALIELPKARLPEYLVVYRSPGGGYEKLRSVQIPETLREKLGQEARR